MHYRFWGLLDSCLAAEAKNPAQEQRKLDLHGLQQINNALVSVAADK